MVPKEGITVVPGALDMWPDYSIQVISSKYHPKLFHWIRIINAQLPLQKRNSTGQIRLAISGLVIEHSSLRKHYKASSFLAAIFLSSWLGMKAWRKFTVYSHSGTVYYCVSPCTRTYPMGLIANSSWKHHIEIVLKSSWNHRGIIAKSFQNREKNSVCG